MKKIMPLITITVAAILTSCSPQSGIATKSVEKYVPTPTPVKTPEIVEQIDPADVVTVNTAQEGPRISIPPADEKKGVDCTKYNEIRINGDGRTITVKGTCKQLMINGDRNRITGVAFSSIVVNGTENQVEYSKYVNGKKPAVTDNGPANSITKVAAADPAPAGKP